MFLSYLSSASISHVAFWDNVKLKQESNVWASLKRCNSLWCVNMRLQTSFFLIILIDFFLKTLKSQIMLVIIVFTCLPVRINPTLTYLCLLCVWNTWMNHIIKSCDLFSSSCFFYYSDKWICKLSINRFPQNRFYMNISDHHRSGWTDCNSSTINYQYIIVGSSIKSAGCLSHDTGTWK